MYIYIYLIVIILIVISCKKDEEPGPQADGKILILMYHRISQGQASSLYERSAEDFESDLKFLKDNNIRVISFDELEVIISSGKMPANNCAIITFDDGDYSWFSMARPLLIKYNMKATFFIWVNMIGRDSFLSWQEIEHMANYVLEGGARPFTFGSHTYSHPFLFVRSNSFSSAEEYNLFLDYELGVSRDIIRSHVSSEVSALALPFGDGYGDPAIIAAASRNGYRFIRTSKYGAITNTGTDLFALPSLPILNDTSSDLIGVYLGI
jgi:peptidoglycan/xylan/chitin deacetylase (PgdA/CDA1 family)